MMYMEESRTISSVLRAALLSERNAFRLRLVEQLRDEGIEALSVEKEPRPDAPSVVIFDDPNYAVIYLFADAHMNDAEFEVFRKEAQEFAWAHEAAVYFVRFDAEFMIPENG